MKKAKRLIAIPVALAAALAGGAVRRVQDSCGPFTDVSPLYCPYVLEAYYAGISAGTSATTFSPDLPMSRAQSAVFTTKALNQALSRGSRRAALGQWWTTIAPPWDAGLGTTIVGQNPGICAADGGDIWVRLTDSVVRVRASDGKLLETWPAPSGGASLLVAMGRVFTTRHAPFAAEAIVMIDPSQAPGEPIEVSQTDAGSFAFDGTRIWAAETTSFSLSIITPGPSLPWTRTEVSLNFAEPQGILFDGSNIWVTVESNLLRLDATGAVLQSVHVGDNQGLGLPVFDGANIWVPNETANSVAIVRASDGAIIGTLTGNGLDTTPIQSAFDGQRVLITTTSGYSLWNASTLAPMGFIPHSTGAYGACSDGINFWIPLPPDRLARF